MGLYAGVNNVIRQFYPSCVRGAVVKRIMKSFAGVNNTVVPLQTYLDEIDHVEMEYVDISIYDHPSDSGGTRQYYGRDECSGKATATVDDLTKRFTLDFKGCPDDYCAYSHFDLWLVLRDGTKVRASYPYTPDGLTVKLDIKVYEWRRYDSYSYYYYPFFYFWDQWWTWESGEHHGGPETATCDRSSVRAVIRLSCADVTSHQRLILEFGNVTINGVTFVPTLVDAISD